MNSLNLSEHTSQQFEHELEDIRHKVLTMGGIVEEQVSHGLKALIEGDGTLGEEVSRNDFKVNDLEMEIDNDCNRIIALRQPAASDLRTIVTILKLITDLERVGDEAEKLGNIAVELATIDRQPGYFTKLQHLGNHVRKSLQDSLDAFARLDITAALATAEEDAQVDTEFEALTRQLITYMIEDPRSIKNVLQVMWCARALERIGDHAKNICEFVVFMVKGKDVRHTTIEQLRETVYKR